MYMERSEINIYLIIKDVFLVIKKVVFLLNV